MRRRPSRCRHRALCTVNLIEDDVGTPFASNSLDIHIATLPFENLVVNHVAKLDPQTYKRTPRIASRCKPSQHPHRSASCRKSGQHLRRSDSCGNPTNVQVASRRKPDQHPHRSASCRKPNQHLCRSASCRNPINVHIAALCSQTESTSTPQCFMSQTYQPTRRSASHRKPSTRPTSRRFAPQT